MKKFSILIMSTFITITAVGCTNKDSEIDSNTSITTEDVKKEDIESNSEVDRLFKDLEQQYGVTLGVYALNTGNNSEISYNSDERFAYTSTFKALAAAAILEKYSVEELENVIHFSQEDVLSYAPVSKDKVETGMTIREICEAAVRKSDNTAGNLQFQLLDGVAGFEKALNKIGDTVTKPARQEPDLNEATPGDERDTSTPKQLALNLKEYFTSDILSEEKKAVLLDWMSNNETGDSLIRAGVPSDWVVADKSGAGDYGTRNDIAVVTPPNGKPIFVSILSKKEDKDAKYDNKLIEDAARIVSEHIK